MLTSSKTSHTILTEIRMMRTAFKGGFLLVEGCDDAIFWGHYISKENFQIVLCEGKQNLLQAGNMVVQQDIKLIAGVYDSDFEKIIGTQHEHEFLVSTDENDLEVTFLASDALSKVLVEYAEDYKMSEFIQLKGVAICQHVSNISMEFGKLRVLNHVSGHNVDFNKLSPYKFLSEDWELNREGLYFEYAKLAGLSLQDIYGNIEKLICPNQCKTKWILSQGHDSIKILAKGLRRIGKKQIHEAELTKLFRLAFSFEMLQKTAMYEKLKNISNEIGLSMFKD